MTTVTPSAVSPRPARVRLTENPESTRTRDEWQRKPQQSARRPPKRPRPRVRALRRRRGGGEELLAYRERRRWKELRSDDINDYLKEQLGDEFSAKDFRTWNATVLAAVSVAMDGAGASSKAARKRAIDRSVRGVAELLGNTPAVARRAYIDPRVFDRYLSGDTIAPALERIGDLDASDDRGRARLERAVLDLLAHNRVA